MNCKQTLQMFSILAVLVFTMSPAFAENIDPNNDGSQYAYGENVGWFNFEPNIAGPNVGATVGSNKLTGFIWAENIGWVNFSPTFGGVLNDGSGNLSGYAWGENVGWLNFDPNYGGVTIDADGDFDGWAWGENIGWIHFQSVSPVAYKVKVCVANMEDLANFVNDWLESGAGLPGDLSGNDEVDFVDYSIFASYWLTYCPDDWHLKTIGP